MSSWWLLALPLLPLPIGADRKVRRTPWLTYILLAANVLVYILTLPERNPSIDLIYQQWGVVPNDLHPITLITSTFLHTRFMHLFVNMLFLWVFGPLVEDAVGPVTFLILYFGGGAASGLLDTWITLLLAAHRPASSFRPST
jgi:membrane associated rhomboid family serine protease